MDQSEQKLNFIVDSSQDRIRLDKYLAERLTSVTRSKIKKIIDEKGVRVNDTAQKANYIVQPMDEIIVEFLPREESHILPENIPLDIVYDDANFLVVNKPAGMIVHPAHGVREGTLVNALLGYCKNELSQLGGDLRPGIVHRLDKETSGLLVVAKNDITHVALAKQLSEHKMEREYRAIVWGHFKEYEGTVSAPLARSPKNRLKMSIQNDGKHAITHYKVLETFSLFSFIRCNLETGRTHQIRVHMASLHHPVFSDATYGGRFGKITGLNHNRKIFANRLLKTYPRQMLHALTLSFEHPVSGKLMRFHAPLPADMSSLLEEIRNTDV